MGARFFHHGLAEIHNITVADLTLAWKTFEQFDDKGWSFTDCTSKVVMEQLKLKWHLPSITTFTNLEQYKSCHEGPNAIASAHSVKEYSSATFR